MPNIATNDPNGSQAQRSALLSSMVYKETVTSVGAAIAGDVVRRVSAGVWTPASADTAANCAGNLGIWTGSIVSPIVGNIPRLNFTGSAPTLNVPCYLSTVAGKATSTVPSPLAITVYLGTPYVDLTVSTNYAAMVGKIVAEADGTIAEKLLAVATSTLGGSKSDWDWFYDPFIGSRKLNSGATANADPNWGQVAGTNFATTAPSSIRLESVANSQCYFVGAAEGLAANPTTDRLHLAVRVANSNKGKALTFLGGNLNFGIGLWDSGSANPDNFCVIRGAFNPWSNGAPTAGQVIDTGVEFDTSAHWFEIQFLGDGTWRYRIDFGTWSSALSDGTTTGGFAPAWLYRSTTGISTIDDLFYAVKRF